MANTTSTPALTLTESRVLDIVSNNPGTVERRLDFDDEVYFFQHGRRSSSIVHRAIVSLLSSGKLVLREREISTVGLTAPRTALVLYTA